MHKNKMNFSVIIISIVLLFLVGTCIASWVITISKSFKPEYNQSGEIISGLDLTSPTYDGEAHLPSVLPDATINFEDQDVLDNYKVFYQTDGFNWIPVQFLVGYKPDNVLYGEGSGYAGKSCAPVDAGIYKLKYKNIVTGEETIIQNYEIKKAEVSLIENKIPENISFKYGEQINIAESNEYAVHATISSKTVTGTYVIQNTLLDLSGDSETLTGTANLLFTPTGLDANNYYSKTIENVDISMDAVAYSGTTYFSSIEYALSTVTSGNIFVIPGKNPTIHRDCNVQSNSSLILPYDAEIVGGDDTNLMLNNVKVNGKSAIEVYARDREPSLKKSDVTLKENVVITVNGTLIIGGVLTGGGGNQTAGQTIGDFAQISLNDGSQIICNGEIKCFGYIVGKYGENESKVIIKNGGKINMPFIVQEHRGGSAFVDMAGVSITQWTPNLKTSPFNRFHLNNIESLFIIEYGGILIGLADLYANNQHNTTKINLIGPSGSTAYMISMGADSVIEARYVHSNQKIELNTYGNLTLKPLEIKIKALGIAEVPLSTKDVYLPISWYYNINLNKFKNGKSANINLSQQKIKVLPGATIKIGDNVVVSASEISLFTSIPKDISGCPPYPTEYPTGSLKGTKIPEAMMTINGTLNINKIGGKIFTEVEGAKLNVSSTNNIETQELVHTNPSIAYETQREYLNVQLYTSFGINQNYSVVAIGNYESKADNNNKYGWLANEIALFYDFNDGSEIENGPSGLPLRDSNGNIIGYTITASDLPPKPSRDCYEFKGWSLDPNADYDNVISPIGSVIYANSVLYAIWKPLEYSITYDVNNLYNGVDYITDFDEITFQTSQEDGYSQSYNVEGRYNIPIPKFGEYVFDGWYSSNDFNESSKITEIKPGMFAGEPITIYALWNPKGTKVYSVHFELVTEDGTIIQDVLKDELGLVDTTQTCFSESGVNFVLNNYQLTLLELNNNINNPSYYSLFNVVLPDGTLEPINGSSVLITNSNTSKSVLTLRIIQYNKIKISYEYKDRKQDDFFYAVPKNATNIPNDTKIEYTLKSISSGNIETLWFTENTPTSTTYYRAKTDIVSFDKDVTLYGFKYMLVSLQYELSEYVTSLTISVTNSIIFDENFSKTSIPEQKGTLSKTFKYYLAEGAKLTVSGTRTSDSTFTKYNWTDNPNGTFEINSSISEYTIKATVKKEGSICITSDTLITLADGSQVRIDQLKGDEQILVWNHMTGKFDTSSISILVEHDKDIIQHNVLTLNFSNNTKLKIIGTHALFDVTLNKYVDISLENVQQFIGHEFIFNNNLSIDKTVLLSYESNIEYTRAWGITSEKTISCFANGILQANPYNGGALNAFEVDIETFQYINVQEDIEKYGLFTYEDFKEYMTYYEFEVLQFKYFKISLEKGVVSKNEILFILDYLKTHKDEIYYPIE